MLGFLIIAVVIGAALLGPQFWVQHQMKKHARTRDDLPGTGGELAEHLVEQFGLEGVGVELTDKGDHYDPESRTVRLSVDHFDGQNITAVAVAAHEVGHALQHARGEKGLIRRNRMVKLAMITDKFATFFFIGAPILAAVSRAPAAFIAMGAIGVGLIAIRVLVHLVTLPVEYDASFGKALPILEAGGYLSRDDLPAARSVLKAAALTYVAAALRGLIDLARYIRILR